MPIFENRCLSCGVTFEALILTHEPYELECPNCHSRKWERLISLCATPHVRQPIYGSYRGDHSNPFENFTLQNVRDEKGRKVKVNSLKELRAAERKYNFSLDIANQDKPHDDTPPTNDPHAGDITHDYAWRWSKDERVRARHMASPIVNIDVGIAPSQSETLAGKMKEGKVA